MADMIKVDLADLVPTYTKENNPNKMDPAEYNALVALMTSKGALQTIFITQKDSKKKGGKPKYTVHDGHHRLWAALEIEEKYPGRIKQLPAMLYNSKGEVEAAMIGLGLNRIRGEQDIARAGQVIQDLMERSKASVDTASMLTGYTVEELEVLTASTNESTEDLLDELDESGSGDLGEDMGATSKPYVLEIQFADKEWYQLARRKLRKAGGKSKDLAVGLLSLLGEDDAD